MGKTHPHYAALVRRLRSNGSGWTGATPRVIGVTSCLTGEGVSTVAANLAVAAANVSSGPVLLVDANAHQPSVHKIFQVRAELGLTDAITGNRSAFECLVEAPISRLSLMLAGSIPKDGEVAYDPESIEELLDSLKHVFHLAIFDLPPANELTTCFAIANRLDGVLLVVEAERARHDVLRRAIQQLARIQTNILGVVFNKVRGRAVERG
jgi:capsular exopolysaccharide synthesis family protein